MVLGPDPQLWAISTIQGQEVSVFLARCTSLEVESINESIAYRVLLLLIDIPTKLPSQNIDIKITHIL